MLVAIEGVDGVGKSTLISNLQTMFTVEEEYPNIIFTKEPYKMTREEKYKLLNDPDPFSRLFTFMKDHQLHLREVIDPYVRTDLIITDRYLQSRIAYQTVEIAQHLQCSIDSAYEYMCMMHNYSYQPDYVILLVADRATLEKRFANGHDGMDATYIPKLLKVQEIYLRDSEWWEGCLIVHANASEEIVANRVFGALTA